MSTHAKHVEKRVLGDEKNNFFQWHSGNNVKTATPAYFESLFPSVTWNSELCHFFLEFFGYPSYYQIFSKDYSNCTFFFGNFQEK